MLDILLVDDDDLVRQTLTLLLEREGFFVVAAASGEEALERARRRMFDLVISDVRMSGMSGLETVAALRSLLPEAHMVMITGFSDEDAPVQALRLGVDDYLKKPFDLDAFLARIRELRRRRRRPGVRQALLGFTEELQQHPEFASHVQAVEQVALAAGQRLGLSEEELEALRLAARLHDLTSGTASAPDLDPFEPVVRLLLSLGAPRRPAEQVLSAAVALAHGQEPEGLEPSVVDEVRRAACAASPEIEPESETVRLTTLGETVIRVHGRPIPPAAFESTRARWLLLYLISRAGQSVPQERLRDLFWPDSDADRAQRALVSSVHRLRKALELPEVVLRDDRSYRFNTGLGWWWDVDRMERAGREGRAREQAGQAEEAARSYATAVGLYRGEFAADCPDDWACAVRDSARRT
ncbi:MAG: response regulator, partial [Candidatus Eremiobacterota bacterium]